MKAAKAFVIVLNCNPVFHFLTNKTLHKMKRVLLLASALFLVALSSQAQSVSIKTGVAYTNVSSIVDESVGLMYGFSFVDKKIEIAADFNYFFKEPGFDRWQTPYAFNVDVHYTIFETPKYKAYPILGFNIASHYDFRSVGLNIGVGSYYMIDRNISVFSEGKYVLGVWDGAALNLGVRLTP